MSGDKSFAWNFGLCSLKFFYLLFIFGLKVCKSSDQVPKDNTFIINTTSEHFRCSIIRSSCQSQHFLIGFAFKKLATYTKIYQNASLVLPVIKNVFRFQVTVTNMSFMNVLKSFDNFIHNLLKFLNFQKNIPLRFLSKLSKDLGTGGSPWLKGKFPSWDRSKTPCIWLC